MHAVVVSVQDDAEACGGRCTLDREFYESVSGTCKTSHILFRDDSGSVIE
jgi:hypothetical protein